jgi:hypothetical membrane protein
MQMHQSVRRYVLYTNVAGLLLLAGSILFILGVVAGEALYPGYSTSRNTLSDMSGSCPSIDPSNPMRCVNSVVLQPSAAIFSSIVFVIGLATAVSGYFIHKALGGRLAPALLMVMGIGAMGVGIFPGNAGFAHLIFAMTTFIAGGAAAIVSYSILKESRPMQYVSLALGSIALIALALSIFGGNDSLFMQAFGVGGMERLVAYPIVMWLIALGGYLIALSSAKPAMGVVQR